MNKKFLTKLSISLVLVIMVSSIFLTSSVKAVSSTLNEKQKISKEVSADDVITISSKEEKIMEYDSTTGITKEVDMDSLRESLNSKNTKNGGYTDRIEAYDPLANTDTRALTVTNMLYNPVSNVTSLPYRATCRIKADVYGKTLIASGYVASPKIVVTAAHCVMNIKDNDAYFGDWVAYPGYNNGSSYKGVSSGWSKVYYSSYWKLTHSKAYDWCICVLNSDIGNTTGWYGTQSYGTNSGMDGLSVRLFGYPTEPYDGERQYYTSGTILNTNGLYFDSSIKSVDGFSGGPVTRTSDNYVVGINHGVYTSDPDTEIGVRITQNMIDIIIENS